MKNGKRPKLPRGLRWKNDSPFIWFSWRDARGKQHQKNTETTDPAKALRINVTPLHKGHVGLLACSGMLNGFFGEGESRHIAHWRAVKHVDEFHEEGEQEGETIIRKRERFSHELTLAFEDGRFLELRDSKEGGGGDEKCA